MLGVLYAIWYIPLLGRAPFLFASASVWMDGNYLYVRRWLRTQIIPVDARVSVQAKGPFFSWVFGSSYPLPGLTIIPSYFKKFVRMEQILSQMTIGAMVGEKWELSWQSPDGSTQSVRFVHPERAAGEGATRDGLGALQEKLVKLRRTPER